MMEKIKTFFKFSEEDKKQFNKKYFQVTPNVCICDDFIATLKSDGTVTIPNNFDFQWDNIVKICGGSNHVVGLQTDGKVLAFGDNTFTQCDTSNWKNVKDIFAKDNITIGVTYQDELYIAGDLEKTYSENIRNEYEGKLKKLRQEIESLRYSNEQFLTMQAELKKSIANLENQFNDLQTRVSQHSVSNALGDLDSLECKVKYTNVRIKNLENLIYSNDEYDENKILALIKLNISNIEKHPANYPSDKYVGRRLDGRYELKRIIEIDRISTAYHAYDSDDDKTVTIKIFNDKFPGYTEFIRKLKNNLKAMAYLAHPNIVKVYDASFGDRIQYIVMEYIDGITLGKYIDFQEMVPWKETIYFIVQILKALQYAHENKVIHKDINPESIIMLQDGTIKLQNFAIPVSKACISEQYVSPEQAMGSNIDQRSYIYSVGVMLYRMLTGQYPFSADSAVAIAIMILQNDPEPIRRINADIPEMLEEITLKAMNRSPDDRFGSAKEMLDAIEIFKKNPHQKLSDITQRIDTNSSENTADMTDKSESKKSSFWSKRFGGKK